MAIIWDGTLAMGIPVIDQQHHRFVDLIGKLEGAIEARTEASVLTDVFDELFEYIKYHFGEEEARFRQFGCYPGEQDHIAAHRAFEARVRETRYRFADDSSSASSELAQAMYDWLKQHIAGMDRDYMECFKSHGL